MMVKICGMTNFDDALAAVEDGATALGFNFWPKSLRYLSPENAAEITAKLPPDVWKVGVFVNEPPEQIERIAKAVGLDIVQLHGDEIAAESPAIDRVWKAYRVGRDFTSELLNNFPAEAFLLDGPAASLYGGAGKPFDWSVAAGIQKKIIIAGGLDGENVREAIVQAEPWGVDACSRLESSPGRKDRERMKAFIKAALG